jgi:hypothetical protein
MTAFAYLTVGVPYDIKINPASRMSQAKLRAGKICHRGTERTEKTFLNE